MAVIVIAVITDLFAEGGAAGTLLPGGSQRRDRQTARSAARCRAAAAWGDRWSGDRTWCLHRPSGHQRCPVAQASV